MTTLSLNARTAIYAPETSVFPIHLITLEHSSLAEDILISTDPTQRLTGEGYTDDEQVVYGTISRGMTFIFLPVRITLPDDTEDGPGDIGLEIDNIHQAYIAAIRALTSPPTIKVETVMSNALDTVEAQWAEFDLVSVKYDATLITGSARWETMMTEPCPSLAFTPGYFPGLF